MWPSCFRLACAAICVAACAVIALAQGFPALPEGAGSEIVRARCLVCHEADLIRQQRLTSAGWQRELDKMIRWGASMTDAERTPAVDYLAANFGPRPPSAAPAP